MRTVAIEANGQPLEGFLGGPEDATGIVVFAHGSGSGRFSRRNQYVAAVQAVVSRGGRPDLAMSHLPSVTAPTLLIVGGLDTPVIGMNREAERALRCPCRLEIVPGATHLFEEPGTLEAVAALARDWFLEHLGTRP
jgi:putative phosphoribosyl transferase